MRIRSGRTYSPSLDVLEDRTVPAGTAVPDLAQAAAEMAQVAQALAEAPQLQGGNSRASGPSGSLTLAVVTEVHPLPVEVTRPGEVPIPPFHADPAGVFTLVAYQRD